MFQTEDVEKIIRFAHEATSPTAVTSATLGECGHQKGDDSAIGIAEKHDASQLLAMLWPYLRFASGDTRGFHKGAMLRCYSQRRGSKVK